jgi:hypothetical protein
MKVWLNSFTGAEAQPQVVLGDIAEEFSIEPLIFRPTGRTVRRSPCQEGIAFPFLRIRPDGETRLRTRFRFNRRDHHAGIDGDRPFLVGENGIEIELPHLRQVGRELGHFDEHQFERLAVAGGTLR